MEATKRYHPPPLLGTRERGREREGVGRVVNDVAVQSGCRDQGEAGQGGGDQAVHAADRDHQERDGQVRRTVGGLQEVQRLLG